MKHRQLSRQIGETAFSRRTFLWQGAATVSALTWTRRLAAQETKSKPNAAQIPLTGEENANLVPFDELMKGFVAENGLPGASLAIARKGRLIYARGFGFADVEKKEPVQPAALFRLASISKPLTAVATLQLVERGKLKLDDRAFDILKYRPHLERGASVDPRLKQITVLQLLQHTAGWDRTKTRDPITRPLDIAKAMNLRPPVRPEHIVRYTMGKPLDFDPGQRHAYSNVGYLVLGRLIETLSGQPYETYVRKEVLAPLGITAPHLGRAALEYRARGEVKYYDLENKTAPSVVGPRIGQPVPRPYGGHNVDGFEAHGGWVATAVDLVRFAAAFDDPARCKILQATTIKTMFARPEGLAGHEPDGKPKAFYYGCGWYVRPMESPDRVNAWHGGGMFGTSTYLVRLANGVHWAALFNTEQCTDRASPASKIDALFNQTAAKVKTWPEADLFDKYLKT